MLKKKRSECVCPEVGMQMLRCDIFCMSYQLFTEACLIALGVSCQCQPFTCMKYVCVFKSSVFCGLHL